MSAPPPAVSAIPASEDRHNAFTFLRQILALTVVAAHAFPIGGFGSDPLFALTHQQAHAGVIAVLCFFVASGYMIAQSLERNPSLFRFVLHRAARILPGYYVNLWLTVFVIVPAMAIVANGWKTDYMALLLHGEHPPLLYLMANAKIEILAYQITGFAAGAPLAETVNGSLWSLWPEIVCYLYLALFALVKLLRWRWAVLIVFIMAFSFHIIATTHFEKLVPVLVRAEDFGLLLGDRLHRSAYLAFLAGVVCRLFRHWIPRNTFIALLGVAILIGAALLGFWNLAWPLILPWLVILLAWRLPFRGWERHGDFSYGIYIYSFPLQQCLAALGAHHLGLFVFIILSLLVSVVAGAASWYLVENPCLRWVRKKVDRYFTAKPVPTAA